jgi:hypothetical protein
MLKLRHAALIAGLAYLLNPVPYAEFSIMPKLIAMGHPDQTVANIAVHSGMFVTAIFCYLINFIEDIVTAWALYFLLAPVNRAVSMLASIFQLVYAAIALGGWFHLVEAYRIVTTPEYATSFGTEAVRAQVDVLLHSFRYDYSAGILLFAIHLMLIGALIFRSTYVPKWLGILLVLDGAGWWINNLSPYLYPSANLDFLFPIFLVELIFMLWLLIWGSRLPEPA